MFFFFSKNTKQQKFRRLILGKIKHVVVLQKKSQFILFERTRFFLTIRKRDETKKEIEQTKFLQEQKIKEIQKKGFAKKRNEHKQKKHKRE